jgi:hypothetical protein
MPRATNNGGPREEGVGASVPDQALVASDQAAARLAPLGFDPSRDETQEQRARRLFDEMARNIGREAVNHLKTMYPHMLSDKARSSKIWELSLTNTIRNDINWRMRPLLMAMIAMHQEWEAERTGA